MRIPIEGSSIEYSDDGEGLPVVLIHGFANDRTLWQPQIDALRGRCRIIAPDLRGFGGSGGADGRPIAMDDYAADIVKLLDHLELRRAVVGGISLGGYVALAFALRSPERCAGLVLANTRAGADPPEWAAFREEMVRSVEARGAEAVVENYGDKPFSSRCPGDIKEAVRAVIRRQPVGALVSGTRGMAQRPDRTAALSAIHVPTLIIHGTEDRYIPPSEAEAMHRGIAHSRYVLIEGGGHLSNLDSAADFNRALGEFLATIPTAARA